MGCLLKLIFLPFWWAFRLLFLAVRFAWQRTTPPRFAGYLFALLVAVVAPGALLGALVCRIAAAWYRPRRRKPVPLPMLLGLYTVALALAVVAYLLWRWAQNGDTYWVVSAWGGQLFLALILGGFVRLIGYSAAWNYLGLLLDPRRILATWGTALLLGPAVYSILSGVFFRAPQLERQLRDQALFEDRWKRAVQPRVQTRALRRALRRARGHPRRLVRWGWDQVNDWAFDVDPADLARHLTLLGVTGSGKTTAIARLAEGLLSQGWAVVFLDCKGGGLRLTSRRLAEERKLPYRLVDPVYPEQTLRYNPCTGTPTDVSNKLIGAFSFGSDGEVYKQVSQVALGIVSAALQALGRPVTLDSLRASLTVQGMRGFVGDLAKMEGENARDLSRLLKDAIDGGRLQTEALETLRARLSNFQRSHFAPILAEPTAETAFDLDDALSSGVTYVSLPSTAASEDVPLMGRILLQDLKQAVARRERKIGGFAQRLPDVMAQAVAGSRTGNVLLVIDEFAALQDPIQLQDLLLQARSAGVTLALSSQLLPQDPGLAAAVKSVGVVASLRVSAVDAEQIAELFGTYEALEVTHQSGQVGGHDARTGTGSVRTVQRFIAHPNEIKRLPDAVAVVKTDRAAGRGRQVTAVRFWPAVADWPQEMPAAPYASVPSVPVGDIQGILPPDTDLPLLPEPRSAPAF